MAEQIGEIDFDAYVDGQLDPARCLEVQDYLARHPEMAARVMSDLCDRDALRLLARRGSTPPAALVAAASRLDGALARRRLLRLARPVGTALALIAAIWLGANELGELAISESQAAGAPHFVEEAAVAHRTALVRAAMRSQPEVAHLDADELHRATGIVLPSLPAGWRVLDVQVFPADEGLSLQVTVDRGDGEPVSLFAVRTLTAAPARPDVVRRGREAVAYWQAGEVAMALTGEKPEAEIDRDAEDLADNVAG